MSQNPRESRRQWIQSGDWPYLAVACLLALASFASLYSWWRFLNEAATLGIVIAVWAYVLVILFEVVYREDVQEPTFYHTPSKACSVLILPLLLVCVVCSFASLYIQCGQIATTRDERGTLQSPDDAIYFSVVTLASLGYGDFAPLGKRGQWYVVLHMATGVLLLVFGLPLVVGRLATLRQDA